MLIKPSLEQINTYKEFAYELSQDLSKSFFPTYLDEIKTKEDFMEIIDNAIDDETSETLLYLENDEILGFIQYYFLKEDKYIGFEIFNIKRNIKNAIAEFLDYINNKFIDYQINFGLPKNNIDAIKYLEEKGFINAEDTNLFTLNMDKYEIKKEDKNIIKVNKDNYDDFKKLHDIEDMYWNSNRLYEALLGNTHSVWHMYLYYENNKPVGNIYFTYVGNMMEIFGIDVIDDINISKKLLIKALNKTKEDGIKYVSFFAENEEREIAKEIGLKFICEYVLYLNKEY